MKPVFDPKIVQWMRDNMHPNAPFKAPVCIYWKEADILEVICGDDPCDSNTPFYVSDPILKGVNVLRKSYPKDIYRGDSFAGLQIWGGIGYFLSNHYNLKQGGQYETFRLRFNETEQEIPVKEMIESILTDPRGLVLPGWQVWQERVMRALSEQNPMVHVPLLKLK